MSVAGDHALNDMAGDEEEDTPFGRAKLEDPLQGPWLQDRRRKLATFTGWQTMPPSVRYGLII